MDGIFLTHHHLRVIWLLLLLTPTLPAQATPDFTAPASWLPTTVPFSFRYANTPSATLLPTWQATTHTTRTPSGQTTTYTWLDPATRLQITADLRTFADSPGTADWVLHLHNLGTADTPLIDDLLPLHTTFPLTVPEAAIHHAAGSLAHADDFRPLEERVGKGASVHLASQSGDSSSGDSLPFFNLNAGDHGLVAAIGWTGNWKADLIGSQDGHSLEIAAGMQHTHFVLHPGEEVRSPRIVLMPWSTAGNTTWQDAQNLWRRLLFTHYTPRESGHPMRGPILFGSWGSEPIASKLAFIDWVHHSGIPVTLYAVDAGWYGQSVGAESDPTNPWYQNRGDWYPSPLYYPNGIKPLGDALHRDHLDFSLWFEPETSVLGRKIITDHPTWFLHSDRAIFTQGGPGPEAGLANLGDPVALAGITRLVSDLITSTGLTWLRQDFNIPPERYWQLADTPDRIGITEMHYIAGLYQLWDTLLRTHPGLHIDNCASGGRRLDLEMISRSFAVWRTDYGYADTLAEQAQMQGLAPWVPMNMGFDTYSTSAPWTRPGAYGDAEDLYRMRLAYNIGYGVGPGATGLNDPAWVTFITRALTEYREVQPLLFGDFYPLVSTSLSPDTWTASQWNRPEHHDGLAIVLRRPDSPFTTIDLALHHLDPNRRYTVEIRTTLDHAPTQLLTGEALTHLHLTLPQPASSALIFYQATPTP